MNTEITREQRNAARNAILDTWGASDYRTVFAHVNPFQLITALDDAIEAVWKIAGEAVTEGAQGQPMDGGGQHAR